VAESGKPSSGFVHPARIHAYANSPLIEIDYFTANTDSREGAVVEGSMSSKVSTKSLVLKITPEQPIVGAIHSRGSTKLPGAIVQSSPGFAQQVSRAGHLLGNWRFCPTSHFGKNLSRITTSSVIADTT